MANWNLESFDNIYASLAESAYRDRPNRFVYEQLNKSKQNRLNSGQAVSFDFSVNAKDNKNQITQGGGTDLPNEGIVYLQPDKQGLLEDEATGYNGYFVTDTETINQDTHQAYFVNRGSDGFGVDFGKFGKDLFGSLQKGELKKFNYEDWVSNDAAFALTDATIPQAKHATEGMKAKIAELNEKAAPDAKMSVTGHSLGTMVSIQGAAGLSVEELEKIDHIVLFNGPDATASLKKAGISEEKLKLLDEKITYYVNPFDPVSMLNREKPLNEQLGQVNVIVPREYTSMTASHSSHDFGAYQMDSHGNPLVASKDYHPELLTAGQNLAELNKKTIANLKMYIPEKLVNSLLSLNQEQFNELTRLSQNIEKVDWDLGNQWKNFWTIHSIAQLLGVSDSDIYGIYFNRNTLTTIFNNYQKEYDKIIQDTKKASIEWDKKQLDPKNPNNYHARIARAGSYAERILLRTELLYTATNLGDLEIDTKITDTKTALTDAETNFKSFIDSQRGSIRALGSYLSASELESIMAGFTFDHLWDKGVAETDTSNLNNFKTKMLDFSSSLIQCAVKLEEVDAQGAADIFAALS